MSKRWLTGIAGICVLISGVVIAEGPHDKAIEARQAMFKLYGYHVGLLSGMAKGKIEYDAALALEAAQNLDAAANLGQSTLWPMGSDNSNADNATNRALPEIWETYPAIVEKGDALKEATANLVANAGNGLDALKSSMGDVGGACKDCHTDFRAKKK